MIILVYVDKSPHIIYVQFNTLSEEIESKKIQCDFNSAQLNKNSFKASYRNTLCWEMIRIQDYKDKWDSQQRRSRSLKVLPSSKRYVSNQYLQTKGMSYFMYWSGPNKNQMTCSTWLN
jgi:hypothetical protein